MELIICYLPIGCAHKVTDITNINNNNDQLLTVSLKNVNITNVNTDTTTTTDLPSVHNVTELVDSTLDNINVIRKSRNQKNTRKKNNVINES